MIPLLVHLLIFILIAGLIYWIITIVPLPPPFRTIALVIFAVILIIVLLSYLAGGGYPLRY